MGGDPLVAVNLLAWPRDRICRSTWPPRCCAAAPTSASEAECYLAGGHSIDDREPKYGMAVTGLAHPERLLRNDAGVAGTPLTLTKPLGLGVLNNRHKSTGEVFPEAVATMTHAEPRRVPGSASSAGSSAPPTSPASGCSVTCSSSAAPAGSARSIDAAAVPYLDGARESLAAGYVPGGTRRNLDWVRPHLDARVDDDELLLLADAQTSGGLLVAGELPGHPVIGRLVPSAGSAISVR